MAFVGVARRRKSLRLFGGKKNYRGRARGCEAKVFWKRAATVPLSRLQLAVLTNLAAKGFAVARG